LIPKDISKLQTHEIEAYISEPYKRSGDLLSGYRIALDPKKWEEEREAAMDAVEEDAEIDQLDSENEEGSDKKLTKTKKRKREADTGVSSAKSKSKPRTKKGSTEPVGKKKSVTSKGKKSGVRSKAMVESEDDGDHADDDDAGPSKKTSSPPTKKAKRDEEDEDREGNLPFHFGGYESLMSIIMTAQMLKDPEAVKVRDWRHKLQKTFLSHKNLPKEEANDFMCLRPSEPAIDRFLIFRKCLPWTLFLRRWKITIRSTFNTFRCVFFLCMLFSSLRSDDCVDVCGRLCSSSRRLGKSCVT